MKNRKRIKDMKRYRNKESKDESHPWITSLILKYLKKQHTQINI